MGRGNSKPLYDVTNIEARSIYKLMKESGNYKAPRTRNKTTRSHFTVSELLLSKLKSGHKAEPSNCNSVASSIEFSVLEEGCVKKVPHYSCRLILSDQKLPSNPSLAHSIEEALLMSGVQKPIKLKEQFAHKRDSVTPIKSALLYISRNEREKIHRTKCSKELFKVLEAEDYVAFKAAVNERSVLLVRAVGRMWIWSAGI